METAANPLFLRNVYLEALFKYHVLGETSFPNPGYPPYYDQRFFDTIKQVHERHSLDIRSLTTRQWYQVLLGDQLLMIKEDPSSLVP